MESEKTIKTRHRITPQMIFARVMLMIDGGYDALRVLESPEEVVFEVATNISQEKNSDSEYVPSRRVVQSAIELIVNDMCHEGIFEKIDFCVKHALASRATAEDDDPKAAQYKDDLAEFMLTRTRVNDAIRYYYQNVHGQEGEVGVFGSWGKNV